MDAEHLLDLPGRKQAQNSGLFSRISDPVWRAAVFATGAADIAKYLQAVDAALDPSSLSRTQRLRRLLRPRCVSRDDDNSAKAQTAYR